MLLLSAILLAAVTGPANDDANPLAPAIAGKLECTRPDDRNRTCRSITAYSRAGGVYSSIVLTILSKDAPLTFSSKAPVTLKGNAVCETLTLKDITSGKLWSGGQPMDDVQAAPILAHVAQAVAVRLNKEVCVTYEPTGGWLIEKATIDGVYQAGADQTVEWVSPKDGYRLAP